MRVLVDENKCCGARQRVLVAPKAFDPRQDGIVTLLEATPPKELHAAVREAVQVCPAVAIALEE